LHKHSFATPFEQTLQVARRLFLCRFATPPVLLIAE